MKKLKKTKLRKGKTMTGKIYFCFYRSILFPVPVPYVSSLFIPFACLLPKLSAALFLFVFAFSPHAFIFNQVPFSASMNLFCIPNEAAHQLDSLICIQLQHIIF